MSFFFPLFTTIKKIQQFLTLNIFLNPPPQPTFSNSITNTNTHPYVTAIIQNINSIRTSLIDFFADSVIAQPLVLKLCDTLSELNKERRIELDNLGWNENYLQNMNVHFDNLEVMNQDWKNSEKAFAHYREKMLLLNAKRRSAERGDLRALSGSELERISRVSLFPQFFSIFLYWSV